MSRIANNPVTIPKGVEITLSAGEISVKGGKGTLSLAQNTLVKVVQEEDELRFAATKDEKKAGAMAGTYRAIVQNMVKGVSEGFTKELNLVGVGYRAAAQGRKLNLTLGFSHPVEYAIPEGIEIETPNPTTVQVRGVDKQLVGQVSAEIRAFRPPEPYKGKGVRYSSEFVKRKEAKKK
ncbi:MAG: 50S ribosomal protein L6 [Pseudomonadales bacterium]|nr:50S ribosomal protein L6 [Pseudomonadales bacterium]